MTTAARGGTPKSCARSNARSTTGYAVHGGRTVVERIWDDDPELHDQAEAERQRYQQSNRTTSGGTDQTRSELRFHLTPFGDIKLDSKRRYLVENLIPRF